jgi:hypothetical protein
MKPPISECTALCGVNSSSPAAPKKCCGVVLPPPNPGAGGGVNVTKFMAFTLLVTDGGNCDPVFQPGDRWVTNSGFAVPSGKVGWRNAGGSWAWPALS